MSIEANYAALDTQLLTQLDGTANTRFPGRREEGQNATAFRSGDSAILVTNADTQDTVNIHYNANGSSVVTVNGEKFEFSPEETAKLSIHTGDGNDTITVSGDSEGRAGLSLYAGAGNDTIEGGNGSERVYAGSGHDTVNTHGGNDEIYGGSGRDVITAGSGNDTVDGGDGNDRIDGGSGNDTLRGEQGNDRLFGGEGRDILSGGRGWDVKSANGGISLEQESANEARVASTGTTDGGTPSTTSPTTPPTSGGNTTGTNDTGDAPVTPPTSDTGGAAPTSGTTGTPPAGGEVTAPTSAPGGGAPAAGEAMDLFTMATQMNSDQFEENAAEESGGSGKGGASGNWLIQLAKAQAKIQNFFLKEAMDANDTMSGLTESGAASQGEGGTDAGRAAFIEAQAVYQGSIQMFTTMTNITSTTLKAIGEAMAALVRKQ